MNHCLTYNSLACLHRLCVMTTLGTAGRGLRKRRVRACVFMRIPACVSTFVCVCERKSQIRYQQSSWCVSAAGKLPDQRLPNTSRPRSSGDDSRAPEK